MMKKSVAVMFTIMMIPTGASAVEVGVGYKLGAAGQGVDVSVALTQTINARVSVTSYDFGGRQETIEVGDTNNSANVDAALGVDFGATSLLFDWYIFDGTFHLTAGMMRSDTKFTFSTSLTDSITVDGQAIDSSDISGNITGDIALGDSFQPYIGIGWGRKAGIEPGLSFTAEVGVALLDPSASLNATQSGVSTMSFQEFQDAINGIENDAESEMDVLEAWPVLSIGVNYAF
ncbi:MAG: hypothetical protein GY820_29140 [Gammaproteobacteria bacterium]|nr:hypothetical protein [Gammaproteobacteria bacterium]